ncbi:unnamed protein product [Allacma fusca]|uniref:Uncharacterized protein n=1 Tax=Allacma fusca TaxID=39272 RepID=A0A8J2JQK8_9HEXA|nr:unnamed protein product [Allacma fusca]
MSVIDKVLQATYQSPEYVPMVLDKIALSFKHIATRALQKKVAQRMGNRDESLEGCVKEVLSPLMDTASLVGFGLKELSQQRRAIIKRMNPALASICGDTDTVSKLLFGDTLDADLRAANTTDLCVEPVPAVPQWGFTHTKDSLGLTSHTGLL